MNNSINIASSNPQKTSDAIVSSTKKTEQNTANSSEAGELEASARSFHDSIRKAYDDSKNNAEAENSETGDNETSGNNLPAEDDFPELAADDDRPLVPGGLYLSGELNTKNTAATDADIENAIDSDAENDLKLASTILAAANTTDASAKSGETASQLKSLVNGENAADRKKASLTRSTGATAGLDGSTEKTLDLKAEAIPVKTESLTLTADKFQTLINTGTQQQALQNIQTSLLLQAASAQAEAGDNALPLITGTSTNSFSGMNFQAAAAPPGIAEAFGRPGWSQAMGKQILMMVNQNISTAEIRLNPAHLGPIEVLIDMSEEQVSVSMSSRHAVVRDAMEQALPRLREMLEQNGFSLADADISEHAFAEQREQNADGKNNAASISNIEQAVNADGNQQAMKQAAISTSMVDYYI